MHRASLTRAIVALSARTLTPPELRPRLFPEPALPRPRPPFGRIASRARDDAVGIRDPELVFFEPADLVAQPGGLLELQVGGRLAHPLLQVADVGAQVMADE